MPTSTPWRRAPVALLAAVLLAAALATASSATAEPAAPSQATCVTARNSDHVSAGRAMRVLFTIRAVGSNDALGFSFSTTSLQQTTPGVWSRVDSCGPTTTSTTMGPGPTTTNPNPGGRPPLPSAAPTWCR